MKVYVDHKFKFIELFDPKTGFYLRSDVLTDDGFDIVTKNKYQDSESLISDLKKHSSNSEPFMRSMPSLIDVGIMGHCKHGLSKLCKIGCYQSGTTKTSPNMSVQDFQSLVEQSKGFVSQFALGGRGDPNSHEQFEAILRLCSENGIVPNYTTSGLDLSDHAIGLSKDHCGAVAVSWYDDSDTGYTVKAIQGFLNKGVKTNIHYVLSKKSINEATDRIKKNNFPKGINAVIFLLFKPVGNGKKENMLNSEDIKPFLTAIEDYNTDFKIGFDSCNVPFILKYTKNINPESVISCDAALFSMYVTDDMIALPCSFEQDRKYGVDLKSNSLQQAWTSDSFDEVRKIHLNPRPECRSCSNVFACKTCPILPDLNFCQT